MISAATPSVMPPTAISVVSSVKTPLRRAFKYLHAIKISRGKTLLLAHQREKDYFAHGVYVAEGHDEAVYADAEAAGRRQAVFQGGDIVFVIRLGFIVSLNFVRHLFLESPFLFLGVVQLGIGVGDFPPLYEQFEAFGQLRLVRPRLGERRIKRGILRYESRFRKMRLHHFIENVV